MRIIYRSAFILKYLLQNLKISSVAKRTIHDRILGHPVDTWVAFGDCMGDISGALSMSHRPKSGRFGFNLGRIIRPVADVSNPSDLPYFLFPDSRTITKTRGGGGHSFIEGGR